MCQRAHLQVLSSLPMLFIKQEWGLLVVNHEEPGESKDISEQTF